MRSEAEVQQDRRGQAAKEGRILWRNNVGALKDTRGVWVRYGLANESIEENKKIKSADLIGITPVLITPDMVGKVLGVFTSEEIKREGWKCKGTAHEKAQIRWAEIVCSYGGIARIINV